VDDNIKRDSILAIVFLSASLVQVGVAQSGSAPVNPFEQSDQTGKAGCEVEK